jgi:hypothetical protein
VEIFIPRKMAHAPNLAFFSWRVSCEILKNTSCVTMKKLISFSFSVSSKMRGTNISSPCVFDGV